MACERKLERENVPIWLSIQLDVRDACEEQAWAKNDSLHQLIKPKGWIVEIPFLFSAEGSQGVLTPDSTAIAEAIFQLQSLNSQLGIHFLLENPHNLVLDAIHADESLAILYQQLTEILPFNGKIFISGLWMQRDIFRKKLLELLPHWQQAFPNVHFVPSGRAPVLFSPSFPWQTSKTIGIIYDSPADEQFKPHFRALNRQLSERAGPNELFILQSNLLGTQKSLLYKNQLRFWSAETSLRGIVINSLYCTHSLADSSSRFGMAQDRDLIELLMN